MYLTILGKKVKISKVKMEAEDSGEYKDLQIKINNTLTCRDDIRSTLLHEALHAVLDITGHSQRLSSDDEEAIVYAIENGLYPVLVKIMEYDK